MSFINFKKSDLYIGMDKVPYNVRKELLQEPRWKRFNRFINPPEPVTGDYWGYRSSYLVVKEFRSEVVRARKRNFGVLSALDEYKQVRRLHFNDQPKAGVLP